MATIRTREIAENPRYISTGRKLDIKTSVHQYPGKDGMTYEDRGKMWKQQKAIREGVKPTADDLALLHTLHAETDNAVVAAIWGWYSQHGCLKLSALTYLRGLAARIHA